MLSKVMALELGQHKVRILIFFVIYLIFVFLNWFFLQQIRVNCVNPTVVLTEMGRLVRKREKQSYVIDV